jgi:hypothetical protein
MDVPDPSTVISRGAWGMLRLLKLVCKRSESAFQKITGF